MPNFGTLNVKADFNFLANTYVGNDVEIPIVGLYFDKLAKKHITYIELSAFGTIPSFSETQIVISPTIIKNWSITPVSSSFFSGYPFPVSHIWYNPNFDSMFLYFGKKGLEFDSNIPITILGLRHKQPFSTLERGIQLTVNGYYEFENNDIEVFRKLR